MVVTRAVKGAVKVTSAKESTHAGCPEKPPTFKKERLKERKAFARAQILMVATS